jgi:hypothetical protein
MNFLQIFIIKSCRLLFKWVGWLNSEAIFHAYMPPIESVVAISSMLMWHYWSPYLSEREVCFGGSTNWFGTLPAHAWEDFIYPNHDPDRNRPFYLMRQLSFSHLSLHTVCNFEVVRIVCYVQQRSSV